MRRGQRRILTKMNDEGQSEEDLDKIIKKIDKLKVTVRKRDDKQLKDQKQSFKAIYFLFPLILIITSISLISLTSNPQSTTNKEINGSTDVSSDYIFRDLSGNNFDLIQYKGKHIILDYMGTTCIPCIQQVEILKDFVKDYGEVVVVSFSSESIEVLNAFVTDTEISWLVFHDAYRISIKLGITHMPTLIHFTPEFIVGHRNLGVTTYETLGSWVA